MSDKLVQLKNSEGDTLTPNTKGMPTVGTDKIQDGAVTADKLDMGSISSYSQHAANWYDAYTLGNGIRVVHGTIGSLQGQGAYSDRTFSLPVGRRFIGEPTVIPIISKMRKYNDSEATYQAGKVIFANNYSDGKNFRLRMFSNTPSSFVPKFDCSYIAIGKARPKNMLDISDFVIGSLSSGQPQPDTRYRINNATAPIEVSPSDSYDIVVRYDNTNTVKGMRVGIHQCDANGNFLSDSGWKQLTKTSYQESMYYAGSYSFTTSTTTKYLKLVFSLSTTSSEVTTGGTENTTACNTVEEFLRGCVVMVQ